MQIIHSTNDLPKNLKNAVVAVGNFDGIHLGHQEIIKTTKYLAKKHSLPAALLTFYPHPTAFFKNGIHDYLISQAEKEEILSSYQLDAMFIENFNNEFSSLTAEQFIEEVLIKKYQVHHVITGYNFHFGRKRQGDTKLLAQFANKNKFAYSVINEVEFENYDVSTSNIKTFLSQGRIILANNMLGRCFAMVGMVIEGRKLAANKLGFATANIEIPKSQFCPYYGVYLVKVQFEGSKHYGVANIGRRPSVSANEDPLLEVHLLNYSGNLYGKTLKVEFLSFIRPERKFNSLEALASQINRDISIARYVLKNLGDCYLNAEL